MLSHANGITEELEQQFPTFSRWGPLLTNREDLVTQGTSKTGRREGGDTWGDTWPPFEM